MSLTFICSIKPDVESQSKIKFAYVPQGFHQVWYQGIEKATVHTGPKMSVSSIAGDEFRTRENFRKTEEVKKLKALPTVLSHLTQRERTNFKNLISNVFCIIIRGFYHVVKTITCSTAKNSLKRPFRPDSEHEINTLCNYHVLDAYS